MGWGGVFSLQSSAAAITDNEQNRIPYRGQGCIAGGAAMSEDVPPYGAASKPRDNDKASENQAERNEIAQAGIEVRAAIDTETVRGLQLINGGMAAGLVTMLPAIIRDPAFRGLGNFMIVGASFGAIGLFMSLVHNRLRRKCSLEHSKKEQERRQPPIGQWLTRFQTVPDEPRVCTESIMAMWTSMALFLLGAASVGYGFLNVHPVAVEPPAKVVTAPALTTQPVANPGTLYDLQEKCGRVARDWFKQFFGDGQSHTKDFSSSNYTNHYNGKLNRCFVVVASFSTIRDDKTKQIKSADDRHLVDVNENAAVGAYFKFSDMQRTMSCGVAGQNCGSQPEWEQAVNSYMKE
jgi:hypothetical protein